MNAIVKIHCIAEQSSFCGDSWIEFYPENGSSTTFGTWGNDPVGEGNGLFEGLELQYVSTHSRTAALDEKQASNLFRCHRALLGCRPGWLDDIITLLRIRR